MRRELTHPARASDCSAIAPLDKQIFDPGTDCAERHNVPSSEGQTSALARGGVGQWRANPPRPHSGHPSEEGTASRTWPSLSACAWPAKPDYYATGSGCVELNIVANQEPE